jgi:predicted protein tyrosine phosphatase
MFIQNCGYRGICHGDHWFSEGDCILIQITQPDEDFPTPHYKFEEVHQFHFNDVDCPEEDEVKCGALTDQQAKEIMDILYHAYHEEKNVIVQCSAGLCRSGAVVEAGIAIGFKDTGRFRIPNLFVKKKLFNAL